MNLRRRIAFAQGQDYAMIRLHQGSAVNEMGLSDHFAQQQFSMANGRYGSLASFWAVWPMSAITPLATGDMQFQNK
jgi:hypothetical protein